MTGYDTSNINIIYVLILMNEQKRHFIYLFIYLFVFFIYSFIYEFQLYVFQICYISREGLKSLFHKITDLLLLQFALKYFLVLSVC